MQDYSHLKIAATQKKVLLNTTANEVIAHEEHIEKTKKVFVKLFLGEETTDNVPPHQTPSDPIPDPVFEPTTPTEPEVTPAEPEISVQVWVDNVEGIYPAASAPVATPEGYYRFADQSNNYIVFLKPEASGTRTKAANMPSGISLPSVSLIAMMATYGIVRTNGGPPNSSGVVTASDLWPAEIIRGFWTSDALAAVSGGDNNTVNKVWALDWDDQGLTSSLISDSGPHSYGLGYFSLYTGV